MGSRLIAGVIALFLTSGLAAAQVRLAEISGTITDDSGAVLPGATLTATHVDTQQVRTAVTEASGRYLLTALPVGVYEVHVELSGFNPVVVKDYRLGIGESARLDLKLAVASLQETLTVTAEAPLIDPTKSDLSGKINQAQVEELPVNGRNWLNFASLAPGVKSDDRGGQPTAGVGDSRMSKVFVDGGSVQNLSTVAVDLEVSKEIIGEFEVITNRFDAVMGRAGTSIVNAVTKAGTDRLRGSAFFYFRDDSLNATDFFTGRVEPYQNQQYGGTIGGPIVKGKTQVFGSYERQVEPKTLSANTGMPVFDAPVDSTDTRDLYFARVDHSFTANHRFSAKYNHFDRYQPYNNVGGTLTVSNSTTNDYVTDRANFGLNSVLGARFVNQLQVTYLRSYRQFNRFTGAPAVELTGLGPLEDRQSLVPVDHHRRPAQRRQRAAELLDLPERRIVFLGKGRTAQHEVRRRVHPPVHRRHLRQQLQRHLFLQPGPAEPVDVLPWRRSAAMGHFPVPDSDPVHADAGQLFLRCPQRHLCGLLPGRLDRASAAHAQPRGPLRPRARLARSRSDRAGHQRTATTTSTTSSRASALRGTSREGRKPSSAAAAASTTTTSS